MLISSSALSGGIQGEEYMKGLLIAFLIHVLTANIVLSQTKPCPGKHARLPAITGLTYTAARKKLLAARWQPVRTKSFNEVNSDDQERIFWRRGYVELQDCGGRWDHIATGIPLYIVHLYSPYRDSIQVILMGLSI